MTSPAIRIVVSGVRSSWETSETKRRCAADSSSIRAIWSSRFPAISLNVRVRVAISSCPLASGSRSSRWPSASRDATVAARRTGATVCRVTTHVSAPSSARIASAPIARVRCTNDRVSCSACRE